MILYILRHGIAEDAAPGQPDAKRELTKEGRRKLELVLERAAGAGVQPEVILTSPYVRAVETAKIAAGVLGCPDAPVTVPELTPDGSPEAVWGRIREYGDARELLIAGHEPLLSQLVAYLLGSASLVVQMKKAALVAIDCPQLRGHPRGALCWMLTPAVAGKDKG